MLLFVVTVSVLIGGVPTEALAWGPLTHIAHGSQVLADLSIVGMALQGMLRRHWREYLYGCVGADITQAKKYTPAMQYHCHSWTVGWELLLRAETDAQRAFAYGYLSHLAADVHSHNHFVPTQLIVTYRTRALRHVYWEARFDSMQERQYRELLSDLHRGSRFPDCDRLVQDVVRRTLFSFRTNKRIFNGVLAWQQFEQWHSLMLRVSARSRYRLPPELIPAYNAVCVHSIVDLLAHGHHSRSQRQDPTGTDAIALAKDVRQKLKVLVRQRRLTPEIEREVAALVLRPETLAA
jgi:hypothetical protein